MLLFHLKDKWFQLRLAGFLLTTVLLVYFFKMMTYTATQDAAMQKIEMMLMTNKAITEFVNKEQKPAMKALEEAGLIPKGDFDPILQSGSYITKRIHHYYNLEQKHLNHPMHEFKIASNNPLNPENLSTDLEKKILLEMNQGSVTEHKEFIKKEGKSYLYYALRLDPVDSSCLNCHGKVEDAPKSLVARYGSSSGFGYKIGEIVGMNSIYTPVDKELEEGHKLFVYLSSLTVVILLGVFFLTEFMILQLNYKRLAEDQNRLLEDELAYQNEALQKSLHIISQHIMLSKTDTKGVITEVSEALCGISGYTKEELVGQSHNIVRHPDTDSKVFKEMWSRIKRGETWQGEIKNRHKDGSHFWVDIIVTPDFDAQGEIIGYSSFWHDASHKKRMEIMSITDMLTQLFNRRYFQMVFDQERQRAKREKKLFVFLMMDLDYFKRYNDTYGHQEGDKVLVQTAQTMRDTFNRSTDFTFRLGGEEFGVIYSAEDEAGAIAIANRLRENLESQKIEHTQNKASDYVTASIGIAFVGPGMEMDMDTMMSKADEALYRAKDAGRNRVSQ